VHTYTAFCLFDPVRILKNQLKGSTGSLYRWKVHTRRVFLYPAESSSLVCLKPFWVEPSPDWWNFQFTPLKFVFKKSSKLKFKKPHLNQSKLCLYCFDTSALAEYELIMHRLYLTSQVYQVNSRYRYSFNRLGVQGYRLFGLGSDRIWTIDSWALRESECK
jgi:hypothetical protein